MSAGLERQLEPVSTILFDRARIAEGERVVDVGCGTGPTTREAARHVGATGRVTGLDLVTDMIDAARAATTDDDDAAPIEWVTADATSWDAPDASFDVVLSRFGLMFFDDPFAAFANLARVTAPAGRLHACVWADRTRSPFFELPLSVALDVMVSDLELHPTPPPTDIGPFSLGDRGRVEPLLEGAGWASVAWDEHVVELAVGGGQTPDEAAAASMELGPVRVATADLDDAQREVVADAIAAAYADHLRDGAVVLDGSIVIVSATRHP